MLGTTQGLTAWSWCAPRLVLMLVLTGRQLIGITRGLKYLHDNGIVHGCLECVSGDNSASRLLLSTHKICPQWRILIDEAGIPRLQGFTEPVGETLRYRAPEQLGLRPEEQVTTYESDVYSLSMVIVEVCLFLGVFAPESHSFSIQARDRKAAISGIPRLEHPPTTL